MFISKENATPNEERPSSGIFSIRESDILEYVHDKFRVRAFPVVSSSPPKIKAALSVDTTLVPQLVLSVISIDFVYPL